MYKLKELRRRIAEHCRDTRSETAIPGLTLLRSDKTMSAPLQVIYTPMVCLIAQGKKQVMLGNEVLEYDAAKYLISSVDLPVSGLILEATRKRPYLALSLALDPETLSRLLSEIRPEPRRTTVPRGLAVTPITPELLDCFVRLLKLLHSPPEIPFVAPLIVREILFRLLTGEQSAMLRQVAMQVSRTRQVVQAIDWIRRNYAQPFRIGELVRVSSMSPQSLHRHFKAVTSMSPLQYQKQVRLQEARRILIAERQDAAAAGFSVGYDSPSQFSREYSRLFGAPPRQDADRFLHGFDDDREFLN